MTEILAFGTIWFWILILVASGLIINSIEDDDDNWGSNIYFILCLAALYFLGNSQFFNSIGLYIIHNPSVSILVFLGYLLIGSIWSVVKWFFYLRKAKEKYKNDIDYFDIKKYNVDRNKERILHWMIYWPLSSIWTLINDPIKKSFEFILSQFGGFYNKMSESILGDIIKEKEVKDKEKQLKDKTNGKK